MHWLQHFLGTDSGSGTAYLWWSGAGSDLAYLSFGWAALVLYRRHNCRMRWCWRIGRHDFTDPDGITRALCWRHHPDVKHRQLTRERLHLYLGERPGKG